MSDDEEGGGGDADGGEEAEWAHMGGSGSGGGGGGRPLNEEAEYGYFDNGYLDADYNQVHQQLAYQEKRRRIKRTTADSQRKADAQTKHNKVEADQLFPWSNDHPQDPRIMGVDYEVVNGVTYYCNVNLWLLLYRQAQTGEPVM